MSNPNPAPLRRPLRLMISGGGTGGHIFPAIAIASAVRERLPDAEVLFVGAEGRMEMTKVPAAGYRIEGLPIRGFQRGAVLANLGLPWMLLRSFLKARRLVRTFRPDVAVGVGGYASGPLIAVAQRMGVPTLIQEQNSHAGKTNIHLGRRAQRICVAYPGMEKYFPKDRLRLTGNPVRSATVQLEGKRAEALAHFGLLGDAPIVLVTGGSLGARGVNHGVAAALAGWKGAGVQVIWQTGTPFLEQARKAVADLAFDRCRVSAFIDRMDLAYACADVVVARAGAISISELCLVKLPAVLVPLPTAAEDHQTANARALTDRGATLLVRDNDTREELGPTVLSLLNDAPARERMRTAISAFGRPDAAGTIADEVIALANTTTRP
ncbi:MAG: undecaprenyldiphospho-muramoylpentapeptide beta-N-acetylglucosaminyltransferase [Flavobacteriales bacterium]|nr:undecaprenyldiphospho-muramoylpentapeptide beta-N-acetylglucosaminyltransferase [Flavobacteriales bacterium]MBK7942592.1 undecaprenyldiphospho-muramoylpentapeptide beta-N-acetylglucosaminyltransferase [Flavobacteriales bacterium]MBK9699005.1 undecaprenyldiphospho-muramoylpentapeptide beta-N-acetylglucosaminyltransferase [Flavobacteriales bacterium]